MEECSVKIEDKYDTLKGMFGPLGDFLPALYREERQIQNAHRKTPYDGYDSDRPTLSLREAVDHLMWEKDELSCLGETVAKVGAIVYRDPDDDRLFVLHGGYGTEEIRIKKHGWITSGAYVLKNGKKELLTKKILYELLYNVSCEWEKLVDSL